ncbi:MAG: hypothetical protein COA42_22365 [Alteromonadaceae bacterium]|nr:MAG: hypothetical protein COA42_22365 [Alteromonadaceae bacterium]
MMKSMKRRCKVSLPFMFYFGRFLVLVSMAGLFTVQAGGFSDGFVDGLVGDLVDDRGDHCFSGKSSGKITFLNFGEIVVLCREGDFYRLSEASLKAVNGKQSLRFVLSTDVLIKTGSTFSPSDVAQLHPNLGSARLVFSAKEFKYYRIALKNPELIPQTIRGLSSSKAVLLVQPDILQVLKKRPENLFLGGGAESSKEGKERKTSEIQSDNHTLTSPKSEMFAKVGVDTSISDEDTAAIDTVLNTKGSPLLSRRELGLLSDKAYLAYLDSIGVPELQQRGLGLEGVRIAIIDDGFNLGHQALKHIKPHFAYDLDSQTLSLNAVSKGGDHGTRVAGIIWGQAEQPVKGLAPNAKFIALRHTNTWTSLTLLAFHLAQLSAADIVNCSWNSHWLAQPVADAINELTVNGRSGKGAAVIFAAGNDAQYIQAQSIEASVPSAIVVGAIDRNGRPLPSNNFGPSVDLLMYGDDVRTSGARGGYTRLSGTSATAAITTGVAALILASEPTLTLTELNSALALLANQFDGDDRP